MRRFILCDTIQAVVAQHVTLCMFSIDVRKKSHKKIQNCFIGILDNFFFLRTMNYLLYQ